MARYENKLSTLQSRTIMYLCEKEYSPLYGKDDITEKALFITEKLEKAFPDDFPAKIHKSVIAFSLAYCAKLAVKNGDLSVVEYISNLAEEKQENENSISDFGAFGDLFEILIRCALVRKYSLVRWSALSVKGICSNDIISKKYGKIEVGHNGKSLTFGTLFDYMNGDYTSFVYGVFSSEEKEEVYNLCINGEYEEALDFITTNSVLWENKYTFQLDMDNLTRGKGITKKGEDIQVVFNPGKYRAFINAISTGKFISLFETLRRG